MSKRIAYLISCSDHYDHRLRVVDEYLQSRGYATVYVTSDFDHTTKRKYQCAVPGCVQLHVRPYRHNLSIARIVSHWQFARKVYDHLERLSRKPDVIVGLLPPNFLAHYLARYKKHHPEVKLFFDIFDLWPETFPIGKLKGVLAPVFCVWAKLRDSSLPAADGITTVCGYFRNLLPVPQEKTETIYLCAESLCGIPEEPQLSVEQWELCYLGAINNVIGIPEICDVLRQLCADRPVILHIIGSGERKEEFIGLAKQAGAQVLYHGPVYDDVRKQEIMGRCHFGLNIIRASACIGLTMKSVEYFRHGLPVISNVPADTERLVATEGAGIQLRDGISEQLRSLTTADCLQMRKNARRVFEENFSKAIISEKYRKIYDGQV